MLSCPSSGGRKVVGLVEFVAAGEVGSGFTGGFTDVGIVGSGSTDVGVVGSELSGVVSGKLDWLVSPCLVEGSGVNGLDVGVAVD